MDYLRSLLQEKIKENKEENKKKIELLSEMLKDDTLFLKIDLDTAFGILDFLGVPKENMKKVYIEIRCNKKDMDPNLKQYYIPRI